MDAKARKYTNLFRRVKIASAATVDEQGRPQSRIINIMMARDEGMYIVTARGKPFHKQLVGTGELALSAMCPDVQALKFWGKCKRVGTEWLDEVFVQNPSLCEVYPGHSRDALDCFLIYEGAGEWFNLAGYPINRETFAYGGAQEEHVGFTIGNECTECGACSKACPQQCITPDHPYYIEGRHCLHCGLCFENCPAHAIIGL